MAGSFGHVLWLVDRFAIEVEHLVAADNETFAALRKAKDGF